MTCELWNPRSATTLLGKIFLFVTAFLSFQAFTLLSYPECATALLKYVHTVRLGASIFFFATTNYLGWRKYDV